MIEDLLRVKGALEDGRVEEAIGIAERIEDPYWKSYALKWISQELVKSDVKRAREIALSIPVPSLRRDALLYLTYELAEMSNFREAIETAKVIGDSYTKKKAFRKISNEIAEYLKERNILSVSLSELGIDEEDIPLLEPLPKGLKFEKGKLMLTKDTSIVKGVENPSDEVVDVTKKEVESEIVSGGEFVTEKLRIEPDNLPEPFRSSYLEEEGLKKIYEGEVEEALKILNEIEIGGPLPRILFFVGINRDLKKVVRPLDKVLLAYKAFLIYEYDEAFSIFRELFKELEKNNPWKYARLMKFLSFELLSEGRKTGSKKLIEISRKLFEEAQRQSSSFSMNLFA
ncbi:hypothetical protein [Pyrococcus abyssi]|nr:hypothetical protein [Pyrococcus abyssi]CAB50349.1 Hypothetical protein PAB1422 [Pyrococcus abyssi GE5]